MAKIERLSLIALLVILCGYLFAFFYYFAHSLILTPYGDLLDWSTRYLTARDAGLAAYLWEPHNAHRLVLSKLLVIADVQLFGGRLWPIALVMVSLPGLAVVMIWRGTAPLLEGRRAKIWVTAVVCLVLFSTANLPNYAYAVNGQFVIVCCAALLSLVLFAKSWPLGTQNAAGVRLPLALLCGVVASLSSANGLLVWPLLLWMAWQRHAPARLWLIVLGVAAIVVAVYFHAYSGVSMVDSAAVTVTGVLSAVRYLLEFFALPWVHAPQLYWPALIWGGVFLMVIVAVLGKTLTNRRGRSATEMTAIAMLAFTLGTALLVTLGRHQLDLLPAHRYQLSVTVAYVALFIIALPRLRRLWQHERSRRLLLWGSCGLGALLLVQQVVVGEFARTRAAQFALLEQAMVAGTIDEAGGKLLYHPQPQRLQAFYQVFKANRVYMYRRSE